MSRTLILVKPDAFERALTGEVDRPLRAQGSAHRRPEVDAGGRGDRQPSTTPSTAEKPFFGELVPSSPAAAGGDGVRGREAVPPRAAADRRDQPGRGGAGSIRGDFALEVTFNMVHGSDSESLRRARSASGSPSCPRTRAGGLSGVAPSEVGGENEALHSCTPLSRVEFARSASLVMLACRSSRELLDASWDRVLA